MRFYGIVEDNTRYLFTDDYSIDEIIKNKHIENIRKDMQKYDIHRLRLYTNQGSYVGTLIQDTTEH